jgi:BirA family biotin operon repressor/biotin-[acetyl-CoA-carboxylase] ligase
MADPTAVKTGLLALLRDPRHQADGLGAADLAAGLLAAPEEVVRALAELNEQGYRMAETGGKWRLLFSPDIPWPWEFPGRNDRIRYLPETASTMNDARRLAERGCPHMTAVIAGIQTGGRGRMDRTWASDDGGLYFTLVLRPEWVRPAEAVKLNFMASLALVETLRDECRIDARVKWPNDLTVDGRKLSGMLSEMETDGTTIDFVNIGIGVNVNNDPPAVEPPAVSIRSLTGRAHSRVRILGLFLDRLEALLRRRPDFAAVMTGWKQYAGSLNRQVTLVTLKETLRGFAEDVDGQGALVLRLADGTRRAVSCGDCFYG